MLFGTHSIARNRNIYQAEEKIMSRSSIALSVTFLAAMLVGSVQAQTEPSGPAAELKKLDFMSGDWTAEGTINPHAGMPGGKFTETTHADWMQGNYFLVQHTDGDFGSMGKVKELAVLGYDPDKKTYTYHAFDSVGAAANSTGTVDGDTWTWTADEHMGGMTMKGRYTMKVLSPTSYTMKYELSKDGTNWTTAMEGKATKK
jgi:hypothetical protein